MPNPLVYTQADFVGSDPINTVNPEQLRQELESADFSSTPCAVTRVTKTNGGANFTVSAFFDVTPDATDEAAADAIIAAHTALGPNIVANNPGFPPRYRDGCTTFSQNTIVQVRPGQVRSEADDLDISVDSLLYTQLYMPGMPGGLDVGPPENYTLYAVHVIADTNLANPVSSLLSKSADAPTLPSGYDTFRQVGWARTQSNLFLEVDYISRSTAIIRANYTDTEVLDAGAATWFSSLSLAAFIPPTARNAKLVLWWDPSVGTNRFMAKPADAFNINEPDITIMSRRNPTGSFFAGVYWCGTDGTQQVEYMVDNANDKAYIYVAGWEDTL